MTLPTGQSYFKETSDETWLKRRNQIPIIPIAAAKSERFRPCSVQCGSLLTVIFDYGGVVHGEFLAVSCTANKGFTLKYASFVQSNTTKTPGILEPSQMDSTPAQTPSHVTVYSFPFTKNEITHERWKILKINTASVEEFKTVP